MSSAHRALERHAACHQCRKSKRKCDGARPFCGPCKNPLRRNLDISCTWDTVAAPVVVHNNDTPPTYWVPEGEKGAERNGLHDDVSNLVYPDWPGDLPSPVVVEHVVRLFFEKVACYPKMIHRSTFFVNLTLPPIHYDFPSQALLHAILCITAPYISPDTISQPAYYPLNPSPMTPTDGMTAFPTHSGDFKSADPIKSFQAYHRKRVLERISENLDKGFQLLQTLQASILIAQVDFQNSRHFAFWQETASCLRLATVFILNETSDVAEGAINRYPGVVLGPARSLKERAERDRTFWMAHILDCTCNLTGTWPNTLHEDEISLELPISQAWFDSGIGDLRGTQSFLTWNMTEIHPPEHRDGLSLLIKAMKLSTQANRFIRSYARTSHTPERFTSHPGYQALIRSIDGFRNTFPIELRDPTKTVPIDGELFSAVVVTHHLSLILGGPLVNSDWTSSLSKSALVAVRAILSMLYELHGTSYDLSLLPVICPCIWFTCAKVLCNFNDAAIQAGDFIAAAIFRNEVLIFRTALIKYAERYEIAQRMAVRLDYLMSFQEQDGDLTSRPVLNFGKELSSASQRPYWDALATATSTPRSEVVKQPTTGGAVEQSTWGIWNGAGSYSIETPLMPSMQL